MEIPSLEDFKKLETEVSEMKSILKFFATKAGLPAVVRVSDIAKIEGVSRSAIYKEERYLLPRFGLSAYPTGSIRWPLDEYLEWRKKDPYVREQAFQQHLKEERKRSAS